ncbi:MAG TPA: hypothetical protein VGR25_05520 [bacterium]|nr:hypothetical protein [bacterium]
MDQPGPALLSRRRLAGGTAAAARGLVLLLALSGPAKAAAVVVQSVDVRLAVEGAGPPPLVRARLQETVATVAQRLLIGRAVEQLRPAQAQLQTTLATVVDRVITGYSVTETRLEVGAATVVAVRLRPDPPVIAGVEILPKTVVHPAVAPLVLAPIDHEVAPAVRTMLMGLPVEALDWAGPLIAEEARRVSESLLPGFAAVVRVRGGTAARVEIDLAAREGRVVRDIGVRFRSSSIPTLLLETHAPAVTSLAEPVRGLPVVFAEGHRADLERLLGERLRAYPPVGQYHVVVRPVLRVAETTYVTVLADSLAWMGRVEAVVNLGSRAPAPELRLHLGRLFDRFELFAEAAIPPNTFAGRYDLGVRYRVTDALDLGSNVALNAVAVTPWAIYRLSPDLSVRAAYEIHQRRFEGGVRYRFHEFLSGELVGTSGGEVWLQVISNL